MFTQQSALNMRVCRHLLQGSQPRQWPTRSNRESFRLVQLHPERSGGRPEQPNVDVICVDIWRGF